MQGLIRWGDAAEKDTITMETICKVPFAVFTLAKHEKRIEGRLKRGLKKLCKKYAVRQVVTPDQFPYLHMLERAGMNTVDISPFLKAFSHKILLCAMEKQAVLPQQSSVALCSSRVGYEMQCCAQNLICSVQHFVILARVGGQTLLNHMQRQYGISPLPKQHPVQAAIYFDLCEEISAPICIKLYHPCIDLCGVRLSYPITQEEKSDHLPLLSVLWRRGQLDEDLLEFS